MTIEGPLRRTFSGSHFASQCFNCTKGVIIKKQLEPKTELWRLWMLRLISSIFIIKGAYPLIFAAKYGRSDSVIFLSAFCLMLGIAFMLRDEYARKAVVALYSISVGLTSLALIGIVRLHAAEFQGSFNAARHGQFVYHELHVLISLIMSVSILMFLRSDATKKAFSYED